MDTHSAGEAPGEYRIEADGYQAIVDGRGATLRSLTWRDRDLILSYRPADGPQLSQGQVLLPWPNRIDRGRYAFGGAVHRLDITEPAYDTAIHGLTRTKPWEPLKHTENRVELGYTLEGARGYPFRLELNVAYELAADTGLTVRIAAHNIGDSPAPYGNGSHDFLTLGEPVDDAVLRLPASSYLPVDDRLLPAGPPRPVEGTPCDFLRPRRFGGTQLDTAFTDLVRESDGRAWAFLSDDTICVALWADASYGWLQVFSADRPESGINRRGIAVEPMTCPPNAFASGEDLIVLAPGASSESTYGILRTDPLE
ncbi:aldose 1-epimerase [Spinactinospora alkalitolerans]|uniref:Aldose 1-epimerase n=1 Tax=Spinactinospora alkalitolerans TaxID=687207 RepID=A0A852TXA9_9ACTN|nr:aldose 1-epimerase family protein [Spinactinospora alkalitolerans]NYE48649.1 aldose 1-epimerase [Spinactinospora alkalitolerans]